MPKKELPTCKKAVSKKIATNMKEYEKGTFTSRKQAIAVAYSQTQKDRPACKRVLKKK